MTWGPFQYGNPATIGGLSANGSAIVLTITDEDDVACNTIFTLVQNPCSNSCLAKERITAEDGDVYIEDLCYGIIMKSPNGSCFRFKAQDDGTLSSELVVCP